MDDARSGIKCWHTSLNLSLSHTHTHNST